jgi:hypothetical protein
MEDDGSGGIDGLSSVGGDSSLGLDSGGGGGGSMLGGLGGGGGGGGKGGGGAGGYSASSSAKSGATGGRIGATTQDLGFSTGAGIRGFNNVINFSGAQTEAQSYINPVSHAESLGAGGDVPGGMGKWLVVAGIALVVLFALFRRAG